MVRVMLSSPAILSSSALLESTMPLTRLPSRICTVARGPVVGVLLQALRSTSSTSVAARFITILLSRIVSLRQIYPVAARELAVSVGSDASCARPVARHEQAVGVEVDDFVPFAVNDVLELLALAIAQRIARDALVALALMPAPHVRVRLAHRFVVVHRRDTKPIRPFESHVVRPTLQFRVLDGVLGWLTRSIQPKSQVDIGTSLSHIVRQRSSRSDREH